MRLCYDALLPCFWSVAPTAGQQQTPTCLALTVYIVFSDRPRKKSYSGVSSKVFTEQNDEQYMLGVQLTS